MLDTALGASRFSRPRMAASSFSVDWTTWQPQERATLLFVIKNGHVLLILKKRGLGQGKVSAPGGRIEPGEAPPDGARREVEEELCVTPVGIEERGELSFQFVDGYSIHATVFVASDCEGEPQETGEAVPLWTPIDQIPYERMWADDALWVPELLEGRRFTGRFVFDGETMLSHDLVVVTPRPSSPETDLRGVNDPRL